MINNNNNNNNKSYVTTNALMQHPEGQLQRQHKNIKNANEAAHHYYNE